MKPLAGIVALGLAGAFGAGAAHATTVFDTTLASPNSIPLDANQTSTSNTSWFNGSGNPQGGFTVVTDSTTGIELGLRAKLRGSPTIYNSFDGTYIFSTGTSGGRALWNYEFSIDMDPGNKNGLTLANIISATLTVTDNGTSVTSTAINPLNHWGDDSGYGNASATTNAGKDNPATASDWVAQNSQNLSFGNSPLAGDFNPWDGDSYTFTLAVETASGTVSNTITVDAVPEPATLSVLGMGLIGLVGARRKRQA